MLRDLTTDSCSKANALLWSESGRGCCTGGQYLAILAVWNHLRTPAMDLAWLQFLSATFRADKMRFSAGRWSKTLGHTVFG